MTPIARNFRYGIRAVLVLATDGKERVPPSTKVVQAKEKAA